MIPTNNPLVVVTPGDPDGIGPEITWKTLRSGSHGNRGVRLLCVGARRPFDEMGARIIEASESDSFESPPQSSEPYVWLLPAPDKTPVTKAKKKLFLEGYQSGWSIEKATRLVQSGRAQALVTGPISKERLQRGGYSYPGHTEMLASLCSRRSPLPVTMMLANDLLRVSLVTTHVALKNVSKALTRAELKRAIMQTIDCLHKWWKIEHPRVAVTALNPHAGEGGLFGIEEIEVITPEIKALQKKYGNLATITGPHSADTFFANNQLAQHGARVDAVVCMYHDQGLIPVKLLDFKKTVNVTLGLPIIRTSVDHGVGFDIAKTGQADPSSLQSALDLAIQIAKIK